MLAYEDPAAAIGWLTEAVGFQEREQRYVMDDGTIAHAEVDVGDPWVVDGLLVLVDDVEAHHARAVEART